MVYNSPETKEIHRVTLMIYFAMIAGMVIFFGLAFYLVNEKTFFKIDFKDPMALLVLVFTCTAIPAGYFVAKNTYKTIKPGDTLKEKYPLYQTSLIIRMATCEGVGLFSTVSLLITSNLYFCLFFLVSLSVIISYFPTPTKIGGELDLSEAEVESLKQ